MKKIYLQKKYVNVSSNELNNIPKELKENGLTYYLVNPVWDITETEDVDGNKVPQGLVVSCDAVVGGDALHAEISAASILAKVTRDRQMVEMDQHYPEYGFAKHKGYPTKAHFEAIAAHGVIDEHRRSYAPVRKALEQIEAEKL